MHCLLLLFFKTIGALGGISFFFFITAFNSKTTKKIAIAKIKIKAKLTF